MLKAQKPLFVKNLSEELKTSVTVILVDYRGLGVKAQQELKKRLKTVNARMFVAKNRLFRLAGVEAKLPEETLTDTVLSGQTAFIISEADPIAPIQVIANFAKEFEIPQFKVGIVEGKFQDKAGLTTLSTLPSKEILFSQVVGGVAAPMYGIVAVTQANIQKLLYILKSKGGEN